MWAHQPGLGRPWLGLLTVQCSTVPCCWPHSGLQKEPNTNPPPPGEDRRSSEGWAGRAVELPRTHLPYRGSLQRNTRLQVLLCP